MFLLGTSERAAVLGVLTHSHVLSETHCTKKCTNKATNFSILVVYPLSLPHHTSLTHIGPDQAGHSLLLRTIIIASCLFMYKCIVLNVVPGFRVACT